MSRITYNEDDDLDGLLAKGRWIASERKATYSKRGQALLKELEDALVALPEKRLIAHEFAQAGQVCALGSVALKRKMDEGMTRQQALEWIERQFGHGPCDTDVMDLSASRLKVARTLAWRIAEVNDDGRLGHDEETPDERYARVLAWVREMRKQTGGKP